MRKARVLLIAGIWIAVLPYLGIPYYWKNILLSVSGLAVAVWAYFSYRNSGGGNDGADTFTENR
jgi:hypothetical protein